MGSFVVKHSYSEEMTQISNIFIDRFMPSANGSYVKVYLYLLRHCDIAAGDEFTIHAIADRFENTEADILRALRYWKKEGVLDLEYDNADQIVSITLLPMTGKASADDNPYAASLSVPKAGDSSSFGTVPSPAEKIPKMPNYEHAELAILAEDREVQEARRMIESMMGTPINESHLNVIIYFLSELNFSLEMTFHAFETAFSKGKRSPRYVEKIGVHWAEKGITDIEEAENESALFDTYYNIVKKHMGFSRTLAPAERTIIDGWKSYHFSDTILTEACKRTILNIGKPNLNYTGKILKEWHDAKVHSLSDIERLDKERKNAAGKSAASKIPVKPAGKGNGFQNYPQRKYSEAEYSLIEKQLLNK